MDKLELTVDHIGMNGDGVAYHNERPYYIPFTARGDHILATVGEKRGKGFAASIDTIVSPSQDRQEPKCRHFGSCGGCGLQHLKPDVLADWKQEKIRQSLRSIGAAKTTVDPVRTSPEYSRRRVEFIAAKRKKGVMIGYHLRRSHQIFDVGECPLITSPLLALVKPLRTVLAEVMPRNSQARLTISDTLNGPDLLITGPISADLEARERLATFAQTAKLSRVALINESDNMLEVIAELKPPLIQIGSDTVAIPPGGFLQATQEGQDALIEMLLDALPKDAKVLDLFSGCGSFSLPAVHQAKSVHAVEGDKSLTAALQTAANSKMLHIEAEYRDLFRRPLLPEEFAPYDTVIIDPPRAGAKAQVEELAFSNVKTIIFISCNPVSYARDAEILLDRGYMLSNVTPIDQFLWSSHVELFSVFTKAEAF
ncbi:class I SAM-dependent RNA methyltransferase [Sneathiella sp.]|jgi:23S rRNA (uracil1939-C5)-methyltransferase|uniref:class I SAM-dependent RNA methyltransferase n=1 Tax=Sneathiella sp. TaxID=1964365 RepID=UPI0039E2D7D6